MNTKKKLISMIMTAVMVFILLPTVGIKEVKAGNSLAGGTYKASTFPNSAENIQFEGDVTLLMDEDLEIQSIRAENYTFTIKGKKTLTINGTSNLVQAKNITIEDATVKLITSKGADDYQDALTATAGITLKNANIEVTGASGGGILAGKDLSVDGGSIRVKSSYAALFADQGKININNAKLNATATDSCAIWAAKTINIRNTSGTLNSKYGIYATAGDIRFDNSELSIIGEITTIDAAIGDVILADNNYIKTPEDYIFCQTIVDEQEDKHVLCHEDGSNVTKCVIAKKRLSDKFCKISDIPEKTYSGSSLTPALEITWHGDDLKSGVDYSAVYKNNIGAGTATVTVTGKGNYIGSVSKSFVIKKAANTLRAKAKAKTQKIKYKSLKKKTQTIAGTKAFSVKKAIGKVKYTLSSAKKGSKSFKKYFKINSKNGKVTVKKGLKKGTYKITAKVTAKGNKNYKALTKEVTFKIKVS